VACLEKKGTEPEFPLGSVILLMVGLRGDELVVIGVSHQMLEISRRNVVAF
jgi:hypothetical protein